MWECVFSATDVCLHTAAVIPTILHSLHAIHSLILTGLSVQQPEQQLLDPCVRKMMEGGGTGVTQSAQGGQRLTRAFFTDQAFLFCLFFQFAALLISSDRS